MDRSLNCLSFFKSEKEFFFFQSGIVYHVSCHRCYQCGKQLSPGEQIVVDDASQAVACLIHANHNSERDQQLCKFTVVSQTC